MRRTCLAALFLLCSTSLFAAEPMSERWRISILAAEISTSSGHTYAGSNAWSDDPHAGVALGVAYAKTPLWDLELTVASQTHISPYTRLYPTTGRYATPVTEFHHYRVTPIDLAVSRHFLTDRAIAPYLRAGFRYVAAPNEHSTWPLNLPFPSSRALVQNDPTPFVEGYGFSDRSSIQVGAGAQIRLTPRTALRIEAARLLRDQAADFDPLTRLAAGVSWTF